MANTGEFKLISVSAGEDEDVVIHAGIPDADPATPQEGAKPAAHAPEAPSEPAEDAPRAQQPARSNAPKPEDDYHETTLEDLQDGPMPTAQKAVIIASVLCIVGAILYYFIFMS